MSSPFLDPVSRTYQNPSDLQTNGIFQLNIKNKEGKEVGWVYARPFTREARKLTVWW